MRKILVISILMSFFLMSCSLKSEKNETGLNQNDLLKEEPIEESPKILKDYTDSEVAQIMVLVSFSKVLHRGEVFVLDLSESEKLIFQEGVNKMVTHFDEKEYNEILANIFAVNVQNTIKGYNLKRELFLSQFEAMLFGRYKELECDTNKIPPGTYEIDTSMVPLDEATCLWAYDTAGQLSGQLMFYKYFTQLMDTKEVRLPSLGMELAYFGFDRDRVYEIFQEKINNPIKEMDEIYYFTQIQGLTIKMLQENLKSQGRTINNEDVKKAIRLLSENNIDEEIEELFFSSSYDAKTVNEWKETDLYKVYNVFYSNEFLTSLREKYIQNIASKYGYDKFNN